MNSPNVQIQTLSRVCNEALILAALSGEPRHGYQIVLDIKTRSQGLFQFKHGTLYPILHRLEKEQRIEGAWSDEGPRGKRKAYQLTEAGRQYAAEQQANLGELMNTLFQALQPEDTQEPGA